MSINERRLASLGRRPGQWGMEDAFYDPDDGMTVTYPPECVHASPPCRGCESWSQFDPEKGSLGNPEGYRAERMKHA